jgi:hypothetical protein
MLLESALSRLHYVCNVPVKKGVFRAAAYFTEICCCSDPELTKDFEEVFAIRDTIVHGHLWEADIVDIMNDSGEVTPLKFAALPQLRKGYGNDRLKRVLDSHSLRSGRLGPHHFPRQIWRRDADLVLKAVRQALEVLELKNSHLGILRAIVKFRNRAVSLREAFPSLDIPTCP